ncbi:MAG: DUF6722 family protein [bacterium]
MKNSNKQENLAKSLYDIGKLSFAALVIGQIISQYSFKPLVFIGGIVFTILNFILAYYLDE